MSKVLEDLVETYFKPEVSASLNGSTPMSDVEQSKTDAQVLESLLAPGPKLWGSVVPGQDLWECNEDALSEAYPPINGGHGFDHSSTDLALLNMLMWKTGGCCEQVERMFGESGLVREKWTDREDYRSRSIQLAWESWSEKQSKRNGSNGDGSGGADALSIRDGFQFLSVSEQVEYFAGCVYILDQNRVLTPDGSLLDQGRFRAIYGGYVFAMDTTGKATTKSAWEAFTESRSTVMVWAHSACFRPELEPGAIIQRGEHKLVNSYVAVATPCIEGDVSRFVEHVAKLLPVQGDQDILLAYMASLVQNPGVKFYWTPLLQGCEGNGKSLIISVLSEAVGSKYSHLPLSSDLGSTHNGWIEGKLFIGIEEVFTRDKMEISEPLKRIITDTRIGIRKMNTDQFTGDNRANAVMCSNHQDAVRKSDTDRRFCIFYTAQQKRGDIVLSGMGGPYFPNLYTWLKGGGYANVTHFLKNYDIPKHLDPAGSCHRAPVTSSTKEAIGLSRGLVEQEILEAVEEDRQGFRGGWISSIALSELLKELGRKLTHSKRLEILESLQYIKHPGLINGRSTRIIAVDGGKPRLFINSSHKDIEILDPSKVLRAYESAQN